MSEVEGGAPTASKDDMQIAMSILAGMPYHNSSRPGGSNDGQPAEGAQSDSIQTTIADGQGGAPPASHQPSPNEGPNQDKLNEDHQINPELLDNPSAEDHEIEERAQELEGPVLENDEAGQSNDPVRTKKESHKEVERRRRNTINAGIERLKALVESNERNKSAILNSVADYIEELKSREQGLPTGWTERENQATAERDQAVLARTQLENEKQTLETALQEARSQIEQLQEEIRTLREAAGAREDVAVRPDNKRQRLD